MRKFRIPSLILLLAMALTLAAPPARALDDPQVDSSHAVVLLAFAVNLALLAIGRTKQAAS